MPPATTSTSRRSATTTTSTAGRRRTVRSSANTSEPVEKLSPPSPDEGAASTIWYFERSDGKIVEMTNPQGLRVSFSHGEVRIYVGANKHYGAVLTDIRNCWSEAVSFSGTATKISEWAAKQEEARNRLMTEMAVEKLIAGPKTRKGYTLFPAHPEDEEKPF